MTPVRVLSAALLASSFSTAAFARISQPTLRDRAQAACYNDAMTLCKDVVPHEKRTAACMRAKRAQLSPGCRTFFK